jgi:hypothetical protein
VFDGCPSLFLVQTYVGGPLDVRSTNSTNEVCKNVGHTLLFGKDAWLILGRLLHPFIHCVKSTGHMLGLADVHYFLKSW